MIKTLHRYLQGALAITLLARASHGTNMGWLRLPPNLPSAQHSNNINSLATSDRRCRDAHPGSAALFSIRGGSSGHANEEENDVPSGNYNDDEEVLQQQKLEEHEKLVKYHAEQQILYQLRSTYLTEMLASRGMPLPTIVSVSTPDGERPPERVDWDCALSTADEPRSCLYSFDAEPDTKVVAPLGTDQWISLSALNRLRRTDPTKVEPMWHSRYSILQSWFSDEAEFSLLQQVGVKGFFVSSVLLDGANGMVLRSLLILALMSTFILLMPLLEYVLGRILVSAPFWAHWTTWGRIIRAGFPLKLLIGQLVWKGVANCFIKVENELRDRIVDLECDILEDSVPVTVGGGGQDGKTDGDIEEEEIELFDSESLNEYDYN